MRDVGFVGIGVTVKPGCSGWDHIGFVTISQVFGGSKDAFAAYSALF